MKPTDLPTRPSKSPTVCEQRPVLRVYCLSLVPGPHPTGSLAPGSGTIILGDPPHAGPLLGLCFLSGAATFSNAKLDCAWLASASSQENGFQISITVGFQQYPNGLPQAQQPPWSRTTGAKTKVGPGNAFLLPEQVKELRRLLVAWECQFHAQEVEKEAAGLEHFLEGSGLTC